MNASDGCRTSKRVLIVEDSVDTARMMKVLLKREGYEVRLAHDGVQALAIAADFLPHVVLLDLTLPEMTGQDVAVQLRKNAALADTLIVAVSGYGDQGVPPAFNHLLIKPVDHDVLKSLIASHLVKTEFSVS
jgi:CheY-like chemotaxis protein